MIQSFHVPNWHPTRLNDLLGVHWGTAHKRKQADKEMVAAYARMAGITLAKGKRRVRRIITLGPRQRGGDPDCFDKSLLDALVACGALKGDSKEWVELMPVEYATGDEKATTVLLEDIEEEV